MMISVKYLKWHTNTFFVVEKKKKNNVEIQFSQHNSFARLHSIATKTQDIFIITCTFNLIERLILPNESAIETFSTVENGEGVKKNNRFLI